MGHVMIDGVYLENLRLYFHLSVDTYQFYIQADKIILVVNNDTDNRFYLELAQYQLRASQLDLIGHELESTELDNIILKQGI